MLAGVKQNFQLSKSTSTGIDELPDDERTEGHVSGQPTEVYNLSGQRLSHLERGIKIVRDTEGRAHKISVK